MIAYVIFGFTSFVYFIYYYFTRTFDYWKRRKVVGPKPIPFFGNIKDSATRRKHIGVVYKEIYDQFPNEKVVGFYRMTSPTLLIRDLDIIKHILVKDFEVFSERGIKFSKEGVGNNLFHCDTATWRALKYQMTTLFTPSKLKNMFKSVCERSDKFVSHMENICHIQKEQEIYQHFQKYTITTIIAVFFGLDVDTLNDKTEAFNKMHESTFTLSKFFEVDMMYPGLLEKLQKSLFNDEVQEFCKKILKTVTKERNGIPSGKNDAADLLIALKNGKWIQYDKDQNDGKIGTFTVTDDLVVAQVFIFFIAGYASSAMTLSNILYQLASNSDIQNKLLIEIDEAFQKYNGQLTYEAFKEITSLSKLIEEALRITPLTMGLQRRAQREYKIPGTDLTIEKGTAIVISPFAIHQDKKHYTDPEMFDPERFSTENSKSRHTCAYLPFGGGPRSCLGMQLGKMQIGVVLAKFLSKFRVEPSSKNKNIDYYDPVHLMMFPKGGIYLNIVPRK